MLLIFIARLYFVFKETTFHTKPVYITILIVVSSLGILTSILGIIIYFYFIVISESNFDPTSIVVTCFGIYFACDLTVTTITMFKFRSNLLVLFEANKSNEIINIAIKYTNLFFWCFISTLLFILIGVSLNRALNPIPSNEKIIHALFIDMDTLFNSFCLYMSIPYFGKNTYNKCCNKIHIYYHQKYTSNKTDINKQ